MKSKKSWTAGLVLFVLALGVSVLIWAPWRKKESEANKPQATKQKLDQQSDKNPTDRDSRLGLSPGKRELKEPTGEMSKEESRVANHSSPSSYDGKAPAIDLPNSASESKIETNVAQLIVDKLDTEACVNSQFTPVLLYTLVDGEQGFIGPGTMTGSSITTSMRVLPQNGAVIAYLTLRPFSDKLSGTVSGIDMESTRRIARSGESPNIVVLQVGEPHAVSRPTESMAVAMGEYEYRKSDEGPVLYHIVSGEEVRTVGVATNKVNNTKYLIIEYDGISAEEGIGFIDEDDGLYVHAGLFVPNEKVDVVRQKLGAKKKLAIVYDRLTLN